MALAFCGNTNVRPTQLRFLWCKHHGNKEIVESGEAFKPVERVEAGTNPLSHSETKMLKT